MRRAANVVPILLLSLVFGGYILYPLGITFLESIRVDGSLSFDRYISLVDPSHRGNWEAVWNSIGVSVVSVILSGLVGMLVAVSLTQTEFPFRSVLARIAILPIALPPLVGVIAFLFVFGESGVLPRALRIILGLEKVPFALDGIPAIVAVHVYSFYVYFYLLCSSALRQLDASVIEAAASLGAGSWRTFRKVILPELRPALIGGSVLTFMASMASFSAPLIFAGPHRFITLQIYTTKLNGDMNLAAAQSIFLMLFSVGFFVLLHLFAGPELGARPAKGVIQWRPLGLGRGARGVLLALTVTFILIEVLPIAAIVLISFANEASWTVELLPAAYSFDNYNALITDPTVFEPVGNSLLMTLVAVAASAFLGVSAAYLLAKGALRRIRLAADIVVTLPFAIPGTVLAISLIIAFNRPTLMTGEMVLVGTFWILPLAYVLRTYPLIVRSTVSALAQLDDSLIEAGQSLGAGVWRRMRKIVLPLILPGVVSGSLLAAITSVGEFVSSILLHTYSSRPISVEILSQLRSLHLGSAAAYCVLLLLVIVGLIMLANLSLARHRRSFIF